MKNKMCECGCGQKAFFQMKNGKHCCSKTYNKCPTIRKKSSESLKKAYKNGKRSYTYNPRAHDNRRKTVLDYNDVFKKNSLIKNDVVKKIILRDNLMKYRCQKCKNIGKWLNQSLVLELDHINGDVNDNSLENFRFLCPNCHAQTPNFKSKNIGNKRVDKTTMIDAIKNSHTVSDVLKKCGLIPKGANYNTVYKLMCENNLTLKKKFKLKKVSNKKNIKKILNETIQVKKMLCPNCGGEFKGRGEVCEICANIKRRKVKNRPSHEQLLKEIEETNYCIVGRKYKVSDNAIRKWIKQYEK